MNLEQSSILEQFQNITGLDTIAAKSLLSEYHYDIESALEYTKTFDFQYRFNKNSLSIKK